MAFNPAGNILEKQFSLNKALTLSLGEFNQPVITRYQLGVIFFHLHISKKYQGRNIVVPQESPDPSLFEKTLFSLRETGVLNPFQNFERIFSIIGKNIYTEEEVACAIDPFAFISHLSAMAYHGLTDRMPKIIFISSPPQKEWQKFAVEKMQKDLKTDLQLYKEQKLPLLTRIRIDKIGKNSVQHHSSIHMGAYRSVKDRNLRVSTIGRTFLDMLKKPDLCGGISHVLDIYREHAERYLKLMIDELDQHGRPIDKVRAGYILEEICGISHERIERWQQFAARGGSRKLDPGEEYSPSFSEKWCISINAEID